MMALTSCSRTRRRPGQSSPTLLPWSCQQNAEKNAQTKLSHVPMARHGNTPKPVQSEGSSLQPPTSEPNPRREGQSQRSSEVITQTSLPPSLMGERLPSPYTTHT
mmetsp:Transcript_4593/g.13896  ORF Transcript_4593/g.13896 Transcript_4593/m.13896 type:complete len:105 (-) Transcript_4593:181-495(-)|eukprot:scaffold190611_cov30-Tisochrysis_lutea.AAC.5